MTHVFSPGDHVLIGASGKVHWIIESIHATDQTADLVSGLTGVHSRHVPLHLLTLHTPASEGATL